MLADRAVEIPRTHDLAYLVELLGDQEIPGPVASSDWLTPWGVLFRYDSYPEALDRDKALDAGRWIVKDLFVTAWLREKPSRLCDPL